MSTELKLMRVGMNMEEATIVAWCKQPGDSFAEGEVLYQIETDKVTFDVEAPYSGELLEIKCPAGEVAAVGAVVGIVIVSKS
jgi:pyruvate/2-oxoglutarate dehydrogenase complex dihydrolipoamide acyltransferase (E2) component